MAKKKKEVDLPVNNIIIQGSTEPLMDDYYYDSLHKRIMDYLTSGEVHSTLVGIMISLDGDKGKKDVIEAKVFADYFINLLRKINE